MSLLSSLSIGRQALSVSQIGLQVAGNNIANSQTPGFIREEMLLQPGPVQDLGNIRLGSGVQIEAIVQQIDQLLEQRLRSATADLSGSVARDEIYARLESLLQELGENDLSTSLNRFFNSVQDVLNQPEDPAVRNLAVLQGARLAEDFRRLTGQVDQMRQDLNLQVEDAAKEINRLLEQISDLNRRIVTAEQGRTIKGDAGALRSQRYQSLMELSQWIPVRAVEQAGGSVNVFYESESLIYESTVRQVETVYGEDANGLRAADLVIADTQTPLQPEAGKLAGLVDSRDEILGGFLDTLNTLASDVIRQFNRVHASGQGLVGMQQVTAERAVDDSGEPLDSVGLPFPPTSGTFQLILRNRQTDVTTRTSISIQLNGRGDDSTLQDLADQLDAVDGLTATIEQGRLSMTVDDPTLEFAFQDDTSGVLAALGINTFFSGTNGRDIDIAATLRQDPRLFAASRSGIGADSRNAETLGALFTTPADEADTSLQDQYHNMVSGVSQAAAVSKSVTEGYRLFQETLRGEKLAKSGVNIDEEAIRMISMQRMFQASARFIATVNELLDVLVRL